MEMFSLLSLLFTQLILHTSVERFILYPHVRSTFRSILVNNAPHDDTARQVLPPH